MTVAKAFERLNVSLGAAAMLVLSACDAKPVVDPVPEPEPSIQTLLAFETTYADDIVVVAVADLDSLPAFRIVSPTGASRAYGGPRFSPDGESLVFSDLWGPFNATIYDLKTGISRQLPATIGGLNIDPGTIVWRKDSRGFYYDDFGGFGSLRQTHFYSLETRSSPHQWKGNALSVFRGDSLVVGPGASDTSPEPWVLDPTSGVRRLISNRYFSRQNPESGHSLQWGKLFDYSSDESFLLIGFEEELPGGAWFYAATMDLATGDVRRVTPDAANAERPRLGQDGWVYFDQKIGSANRGSIRALMRSRISNRTRLETILTPVEVPGAVSVSRLDVITIARTD